MSIYIPDLGVEAVTRCNLITSLVFTFTVLCLFPFLAPVAVVFLHLWPFLSQACLPPPLGWKAGKAEAMSYSLLCPQHLKPAWFVNV